MKNRNLFSALSICCLAVFAPMASGEVITTPSDDPAMSVARTEAIRHLPVFLEQARKADLANGGFDVKWAKRIDNGTVEIEHIWVHVSSIEEDGFKGTLGNDPVDFPGSEGDPVAFSADEISDWLIWQDDGKLQGGWTLRVLLPQMSPEDQTYFQSILLPLPN